ncbi:MULTISPECIES: DUF732 domain-containing protein [Mycolicibacterium]|jgi:hypothetical protein|uniref:DUF732 domain-containing protein n=4 Tax=Mycolicibacterium TaxID=1866885 RepID=A0AAE5AG84_MYCFO|nr:MULTISPECIES: DUF732 domain-containing protein [Mycolicibacterium]MCV7142430.1 DUF732 domain-containing protein [Mycolicibacterium fortuitum]MDV7195505.1 DUF732 domain-containing protein [Mycolicibacterium fortuitum]MDV7209165.1 DUF732 domain-containing protein [Mycolicibacterium fortuitum]MDV7231053.1 DUF732 domain-containing protein [Mycolicibacterium fortuitum]MDV7262613.1 DUF732 domain-containing protein [Mycolicibacterium fortuitum]
MRKLISSVGLPALLAAVMVGTPVAHADNVGYLVNVTVRPGYNFANADQALAYGYGVCDKIAAGKSYAQLVGDIKSDFNTSDEFQASYLISQSAQELCPAQIWQLRNSAAGYVGAPG